MAELDDLPYATVRAMRRQIRNEVIEECAKVGESYLDETDYFYFGSGIGDAIRALKDKT